MVVADSFLIFHSPTKFLDYQMLVIRVAKEKSIGPRAERINCIALKLIGCHMWHDPVAPLTLRELIGMFSWIDIVAKRNMRIFMRKISKAL